MKQFIGIDWLWWLVAGCFVAGLSSCSITSPTGQSANLDGASAVKITENMTDRFSVSGAAYQTKVLAAKDAIVARANADKAAAEARQAEALANPKPQMVISDSAAMGEYKDIVYAQTMASVIEKMAENSNKIAEALKAFAGDKGDMAPFLTDYQLPKGVIAESIESIGTAGEKIANTPAAFILGTGAAMKWVAKEVKQNIIAKDSNVNTGPGEQKNGLTGEEVEASITASKAEPATEEATE